MKHILLALSEWARLMAYPSVKCLPDSSINRYFFIQLNLCWEMLGNRERVNTIANEDRGTWEWRVCHPSVDPLDKGYWVDWTMELDEDPAMW